MTAPNPAEIYPLHQYNRLVFLKNIIKNPNIIVGDYTYYDDFTDPYNFEKNVLYHFDFIGDKLIIGNFCAIASGVKFVMNGGNHETSPISTFPFGIFGHDWDKVNHSVDLTEKYKSKGDTIIGNDVWIGHGALIMPGVKIGNGAIIATRSVVTKDVPDYAIVGGNPAKVLRMRFTDSDIVRLLKISWWDWPVDKITEHLKLINSADIDALVSVNI